MGPPGTFEGSRGAFGIRKCVVCASGAVCVCGRVPRSVECVLMMCFCAVSLIGTMRSIRITVQKKLPFFELVSQKEVQGRERPGEHGSSNSNVPCDTVL